MIIKNTTVQGFAEIVRAKTFVCFGASTMPREFCEWYDEFHFEKQIRFIADNDKEKWNKIIKICNSEIPICSPQDMVKKIQDDEIILITTRFYYDIIEQLNEISSLAEHQCYVFPLFALPKADFQVSRRSIEKLIPRRIFYCWFGGGIKPELNQACIDSWKKYCPDYEIIELNPQNCDMEINNYVKEAFYECKQWGAVSDYFSVKVLYEQGGVYLDTDVELLRNIDDFLYHPAFASFDSTNGMINFGSGAGAAAGNILFKEIQDEYEDLHFLNSDGTRNDAANYIHQTRILKKYGLKLNNSLQNLNHITIFPSDCFCPYDLRSNETNITRQTYGIHHFDGSWWDEGRKKVFDKQKEYCIKIKEEMNLH